MRNSWAKFDVLAAALASREASLKVKEKVYKVYV